MDPRQMQQLIEEDRANKRGAKIDENVRLKICDLGNGCWTYHHFSTQIQTRQYRSPEVLIGAKYNATSDIWSLACMLFEIATGDFLFEPRKGKVYGKDDDHLAQMMELLGRMPSDMAIGGQRARRFFTKAGFLRRIRGLNYWPLKKVLTEKYKFKDVEAQAFTDFLVPMLRWDPNKRANADEMLKNSWLSMPADYSPKVEVPAGIEPVPSPEDEDQYYYKAEMSKLTDGSEMDCADAEDSAHDLFSDSDSEFADENDCRRDARLYRDLANGRNLNNSFGCYDVDDWDHLHVDKGANPQFKLLKQKK